MSFLVLLLLKVFFSDADVPTVVAFTNCIASLRTLTVFSYLRHAAKFARKNHPRVCVLTRK